MLQPNLQLYPCSSKIVFVFTYIKIANDYTSYQDLNWAQKYIKLNLLRGQGSWMKSSYKKPTHHE